MRDQWNAWGDEPQPIAAPRDGTLSLLWMKLRRLGPTRPTAIDDHEGQIRYERDGDTDGKAYLARYLAGGTYEWKELTAGSGSGGTIAVEEGGASVEPAADTLNVDTSDFNTSVSPAGTVTLSLNYGTGAGQPAEGNHTHAGSSPLVVQVNDVDAVLTTATMDFSLAFRVSESPANEANVEINTTSITPTLATVPRHSGMFTITDASITTLHRLVVWNTEVAGSDAAEYDAIIAVPQIPTAGSCNVYWHAIPGPVVGDYSFRYILLGA